MTHEVVTKQQPFTDALGRPLERPCTFCVGGSNKWDGPDCPVCHGAGYVLTQTGRALIAFLARHGR